MLFENTTRRRGGRSPSRSLDRALDEGERWVASRPDDGIPAPRPYPDLATQGLLWMKAGRYWIGYTTRKPPVNVAVYYDQADIPGRLWSAGALDARHPPHQEALL